MADNIYDGTELSATRMRDIFEAWLANPIGNLSFSTPSGEGTVVITVPSDVKKIGVVKLTRMVLGTGLKEASQLVSTGTVRLNVADIERFADEYTTGGVAGVLDDYRDLGCHVST